MKKLYVLVTVAFLSFSAHAQVSGQKSFMQQQSEFYGKFHFTQQSQWDSLDVVLHPNAPTHPTTKKSTSVCALNKRVFGWLPYWTTTTQENDLNLSLLSDIAYCEYDVDATTGSYSSIHGWTTDACVTKALAAGVKVELTAQLFSNHATFFGSTTAENTFITTIINLVKARGANGVNIDFEGVPSSVSASMTAFLERLADSVHTRIPGGQLTIAAPAVNWSSVWDIASLTPYVDLWVIMGYDYYYGGSANAGPCSPLTGGGLWGSYNCTTSVIYYLNQGVPNSKVALGVPYYGYDWPTSNGAVNATTTGTGTAVLYASCMANEVTYGRLWDNYSMTPHYTYGSYHQCWYDDYISLGHKYDMVNIQNIGGIGIWALGYDDGYPQAWNEIQSHFTNCDTVPCSGEFMDLGDTGNYDNGENWTYTIAPYGASSVSMTFSSFSTTTGDILSIYNGPSTSSPLLGNYQGTTSPGTVVGTSGSLTFHFSSSASGSTAPGWKATWNCTVGPQVNFTASETRVCKGSAVTFTDYSTSPGTITGWDWTFTGGTPGTSTLQNPVITYNTPGTYSVKEVIKSTAGNDSLTKTGYIFVMADSSLPLIQTFQSATFPPAGWYLNLPNSNDSVWALCKTNGYNSSQCMYFPANCGTTVNIAGERQQIYTLNYSFASAASPKMWFDVAYEPYNKTYSDTLAVYYSTDCGNTWTNIYLKGGMTLCTTGKTDSSGTDTGKVLSAYGCFIPPNTAAWRTDTINLSSLTGDANVMFSIEDRSGWGNIIYLDNINVASTKPTSVQNLSAINDFKVYPNPFSGAFTIEYDLPVNEQVAINLIDVLGRKISLSSSEIQNSGQHKLSFNTGSMGLSKGLYMIELETPAGNSYYKVIAQ